MNRGNKESVKMEGATMSLEKEMDFPHTGLRISKLEFKIRLLDDALLPSYKGSTIRGLLGTSMLRRWCPKGEEACFSCSLVSQCPYANFFKPHLSKGKSAPTPFVTEPAIDPRTCFSRGDRMEFSLNVFGSGVKWLPFVMAAIVQGGHRGVLGTKRSRFELEFPEPPSEASDPRAWAEKGINGLRSWDAADLVGGGKPIRSIRLATPCKFKEEGRIKGRPDGRLIIDALERRIAGLHYFYGSSEEGRSESCWKKKPWLQTGAGEVRWVVLERPSKTQGQRINIGGWVGKLEVKDYNQEAGALLRLGRFIHVGKNTVVGCGKLLLDEG